jgi:hypothetical protein
MRISAPRTSVRFACQFTADAIPICRQEAYQVGNLDLQRERASAQGNSRPAAVNSLPCCPTARFQRRDRRARGARPFRNAAQPAAPSDSGHQTGQNITQNRDRAGAQQTTDVDYCGGIDRCADLGYRVEVKD